MSVSTLSRSLNTSASAPEDRARSGGEASSIQGGITSCSTSNNSNRSSSSSSSSMRLLLLLFASATAYKLSRLGPKGNGVPKVDGYACIPVPKDKLVAPGQRASMHIYDASSLEVVRYAQAHANSTYGQVVIDEVAMQDRRFALLEVGSRVKLLSVTPSVHRDKFGGSSPSFKAEVIGVGLIEPAAVLQKMPFMTVRPAEESCSLLRAGGGVAAPEPGAAAALAEAAEICQGLEELVSCKGDR